MTKKRTSDQIADGITQATRILGPLGGLVGGIAQIAKAIPKPPKWKRRARAAEGLIYSLLQNGHLAGRSGSAHARALAILQEANRRTKRERNRYDLDQL